jgi:hypothetical protein
MDHLREQPSAATVQSVVILCGSKSWKYSCFVVGGKTSKLCVDSTEAPPPGTLIPWLRLAQLFVGPDGGIGVGVAVGPGVGVGVALGPGVGVGVALGAGVGVGVGEPVLTGVGVGVAATPEDELAPVAQPTATTAIDNASNTMGRIGAWCAGR